jgi:hypothetical protein
MFIPDPDLDVLHIRDPGVKKAPDSGFATLVSTASKTRVADPDQIFGSWIQITIPIRVKSWIRIVNKVKIKKLQKLKMSHAMPSHATVSLK